MEEWLDEWPWTYLCCDGRAWFGVPEVSSCLETKENHLHCFFSLFLCMVWSRASCWDLPFCCESGWVLGLFLGMSFQHGGICRFGHAVLCVHKCTHLLLHIVSTCGFNITFFSSVCLSVAFFLYFCLFIIGQKSITCCLSSVYTFICIYPVCLSVCLFGFLPARLSVCRSIGSIYLSGYLYACPSMCLFTICLSVSLLTSIPVRNLAICLFFYLLICLSIKRDFHYFSSSFKSTEAVSYDVCRKTSVGLVWWLVDSLSSVARFKIR